MFQKRRAFLSDLLLSITARGRTLLGRSLPELASHFNTLENIADQCERLMSWRGEATAIALAQRILEGYAQLEPNDKMTFLHMLNTQFGADSERLQTAIDVWQGEPSAENAADVHYAAEPRRLELFRRLNRAPNGTEYLVAMRSDLLQVTREHPELKPTDKDFHHLLASWFNRGFLELRRIDWTTSAAILDKLIQYEAVHEITDWDDLRRRIDPPDRLCYAFFHPALQSEPLIFVEIALIKGVPKAIAPILANDREHLAAADVDTAVFYSISNCQAGLRGVSFGNFLIKQVVQEIVRDFPQITTFITLSPVPHFVRWLEQIPGDDHLAPLATEALTKRNAADDKTLKQLTAHYFLHAKNKREQPYDPVARFHLGNGARLEHLHLAADTSPNGIAQSCGIMVNYRYHLDYIEQNHEAYAYAGDVIATSEISKLAEQLDSE